jgi:hypothetical protein
VSKSTEAKVAEFSMPRNAKPTRALGRDGTRPHLRDAYTAPESPGASRIGGSGRRLFSLIGWLGLATYGFGLPAAIWTWLG